VVEITRISSSGEPQLAADFWKTSRGDLVLQNSCVSEIGRCGPAFTLEALRLIDQDY